MKGHDAGFGARLRELKGDESTNAFANRCEIPEASMRAYLDGKIPTADRAFQISRKAGADFEWLVNGSGSRFPTTDASAADGQSVMFVDDGRPMPADMTMVPRLEVQASAGHGALSSLEQAVDFVAFQSAWLRSIGVNPPFARIIDVTGDSMEPTIRDGDLLVVDTSVNEIRDNGIYCVVFGSMLLVKRVHVRLNGALQLISDNPIYPPEEVSPGEAQGLTIAGRVRWFGRAI